MFQPAAAILSFVPKKREGGDGCGILCVRVPLRFTYATRETVPPTAFAIRPPYQPTENSLETI